MNKIYGNTGESEGSPMCESPGDRIEDKFVNEICDLVVETLNVNYNDRRIVLSLLRNIFSDKLNNRGRQNEGLLQQYEAYVLDKSSERIIDNLKLEDVKVNHSHATHAKFADIVKAIKEKYDVK